MPLELRRLREHRQIVDLQVALTEWEYQSLLQRCPQKDRHWQTSCYTYLVQTEIAKYHSESHVELYKKPVLDEINGVMDHLRLWTEQYAAFEKLINNPIDIIDLDSANKCLDALQKQLSDHKTWLDERPVNEMPKHIKDALKNNCDNFLNGLKKFSQMKGKTTSDYRKIFSIQSEKSNIPSLGAFIAEDMWQMTDGCIRCIYEITDNPDSPDEPSKNNTSKGKFWNRVKQILLFKMDPAIKALSDAKSNIEVKGRSLHGIRYNNPFSPIPTSMLNSLKKLPVPREEKQWVSLSPFVDSLNDLEGLDKIITQIKDVKNPDGGNAKPIKNLFQRISDFTSNFSVHFILLLANIVELALSLALRIPYAVISTALFLPVRLLESIVSIIFKTNKFHFLSNALSYLDKLVAYLHHKGSLVRGAKIVRNQHHVLDNADEDKLQSLKKNPTSLYCTLLNAFSGETVSAYIAHGLRSIRRTLGTIAKEPMYMKKASKKNRVLIVSEYHKTIAENFIALLSNELKPEITASVAFKKDAIAENEEEEKDDDDLGYKTREKIQAWKANIIEMPIDFFVEIGVGLPDGVVGRMLRTSPGAATFFFMLSNASLGALIAGSAAGEMGSALAYVPSVLSKLFTGKEVSTSLPAQVIAVFLQWKLGFFTTEGIASVLKGDFEFLKEIFHDPEKITLALSILVFTGWAMKFVPPIPDSVSIGDLDIPLAKIPLYIDVPFIGSHIPNLYIEFINKFSEESRDLAKHGQIPASFLEDSFLSLKFAFLCEGLLSGTHKTRIAGIKDALKKSILANKNRLDLVQNGNEGATANQCVMENLAQYDITPYQPIFGELQHAMLIAAYDIVKQAEAFGHQLQALGVIPSPVNQNAPKNSFPSMHVTPLALARKELYEALETVQKMDILGQKFSSLTHARIYFDHLHFMFETYNKELVKAKQSDKHLDPEAYLISFYNKYCYKGSNNFLRALSILPLYPVTKFYQYAQKGMAYILRTPSTLHKVAKSEAKNTVMIWQSVAMFGRLGHELIRAYVYSLRALICISAIPLTAIAAIVLPFPVVLINFFFDSQFKPLSPARWLINTAIDIAGNFSLHRGRYLSGIGDRSYAKAARLASTNSDEHDLSFQNKQMLRALLGSKLGESATPGGNVAGDVDPQAGGASSPLFVPPIADSTSPSIIILGATNP